MILAGINYHYFAPEPYTQGRAIFRVTVEDFAAQLELLGRGFEFVSRDDVAAAVAAERTLPDRACLITFDDGLREQHELALPVLERLGVPAVFFPSGLPLVEGRALHVHKVHWLREHVPDEELLAELEGEIPELEAIYAAAAEKATRSYRYDTPAAATLKYLLNAGLPPARSQAVVDRLFERHHGDEAGFAAELYMGPEQVRELELSHAAVGAHSHTHSPLALLEPDALRADLERGGRAIEEITGAWPQVISYPYGSQVAVSSEVARAAEAAGFRAGFTMERALNRSLEEPLLLARLDMNDAPGGRKPLFEIEGGELVIGEGMSAGRERYFAEETPAGVSPPTGS